MNRKYINTIDVNTKKKYLYGRNDFEFDFIYVLRSKIRNLRISLFLIGIVFAENENDFVNEISYTQLSHANDFIRYSLQFKVRGYESKMYKREMLLIKTT